MRGAADAAAYYLHPAIADCCLHLGAVPAAPNAEFICRVPVGIRAYVAPAEKRQVQPGWAVAARPQAAGVVPTSMQWRPGRSACAGCQLLGLHTKPMPRQQVSDPLFGAERYGRGQGTACGKSLGLRRLLARRRARKGAYCTRSTRKRHCLPSVLASTAMLRRVQLSFTPEVGGQISHAKAWASAGRGTVGMGRVRMPSCKRWPLCSRAWGILRLLF